MDKLFEHGATSDDAAAASPGAFVLVPARGGSKGIPRKNLRPLAGKPLILHTLESMAAKFGADHVILSTDDPEIAAVGKAHAVIHQRPGELASDRSTLDEVAVAAAKWLIDRGAKPTDILVTVQPTSPFLKPQRVQETIELLRGAKSVVSVRDDRHLRWTTDSEGAAKPLFEKRVNRQWLPATFAETGGIIACRLGDLIASQTRIVEPVALLQLDSQEGLDIDNYTDWAVAEYLAARKRIVIRADASPQLGMGHVYRALALAHEFAGHDFTIVTRADGGNRLGAEFLAGTPFAVHTVNDEAAFYDFVRAQSADVLILDILDTTEEYVKPLKPLTKALVSLEDLGPGSQLADIVINDLYTDAYPKESHWYGVQNAILAPQFELVKARAEVREKVEHILVTFGGTDPCDLTRKALAALRSIQYSGRVTAVLGPGYAHDSVCVSEFALQGEVLKSVANMALLMRDADVAVTSGGRTVTELMTLGIPTLVLCQNLRELRHSHASSPFGVINLGLGEHASVDAVAHHLTLLLADVSLRREMQQRALRSVNLRSNRSIARRILETAAALQPASETR